VIDCGRNWSRPHNRLWDENDDYAPPPPRHDREEWQ